MVQDTTNLIQIKTKMGVELTVQLMVHSKKSRSLRKISTLKKYIQKYPSGWKKRLELADLLYSIGSWEQAVFEYFTILEKKKESLDVLLRLGKIFYLSGAIDEAVKAYQHAFTLCKEDAERFYISGLIQCCYGRYFDAIEEIKQSIALSSKNSAQWFSLGLINLVIDSPAEALRAFHQALKQKPDDVVALNYSCDVLLMMGDIHSAEASLSKAIFLAPEHLGVIERNIARRLRQRMVYGEPGRKTWELIQKILKNAPDSPRSGSLLVNYYSARGEWEKGIEVWVEFSESHPNNPEIWSYFARHLFHMGDFSKAMDYILHSHQLYPGDWQTYRLCYEIFPFAGQAHKLRVYMEEMLERFPERWSSWAMAGRAFVEHFDEVSTGLKFAEKSIQIQPDLADAWFQYGRALASAGGHFRASEALRQGWKRLPGQPGTPQSVMAAMWLAESNDGLGEGENSRRWLGVAADHARQMMEFYPAVGLYWRGRALAALGEVELAKQAYREALEQQVPYPARGEIKQILGEKCTV